jgi:hypothetical protein
VTDERGGSNPGEQGTAGGGQRDLLAGEVGCKRNEGGEKGIKDGVARYASLDSHNLVLYL